MLDSEREFMVRGNGPNGSIDVSQAPGCRRQCFSSSDRRFGVDLGKFGNICVKPSTTSSAQNCKVSMFWMRGVIRPRNLELLHMQRLSRRGASLDRSRLNPMRPNGQEQIDVQFVGVDIMTPRQCWQTWVSGMIAAVKGRMLSVRTYSTI